MSKFLQPGEPTDQTSHEIEPTPATKIAKGVTLHTKDGSRIGNAIVIRRNGRSKFNDEPLWLVETDFGNQIPAFQESEILDLWNLGFVSNYDHWWESRLAIIHRNLKSGEVGETG